MANAWINAMKKARASNKKFAHTGPRSPEMKELIAAARKIYAGTKKK